MKKIKSEDLDNIEFVPLKELLLSDNDKIKEIKSLYQREVEYLDFLGPLEFFIANYGLANPKLKDKDVVMALRNIRDNWDKNIDFFKTDFEYNLIMTTSSSLQLSRKITRHELLLVIKHILWAIDNRSWIDDKRAYLNWIANFFHLLKDDKKKKFDEFYNNLGQEMGFSKEQVESLKGEEDEELPINEVVLTKLDSENFDEKEDEFNEDDLWSKGGYIQPIDINDPELSEKMKYLNEKNDISKDFNCKNCNSKIGKHNLYWHDGMCDDCFFEKYYSDREKK